MKNFDKALLMICVLVMPALLHAQPPTFDDESPYAVTDVPFDDGVFVLVAIAMFYGIFKILAYKKSVKLLMEQ